MDRRIFLQSRIFPFIVSNAIGSGLATAEPSIYQAFLQLEKEFSGRLGIYAVDTANNSTLSYRGDERFALCSTFKLFAAAAILQKSVHSPALTHKTVRYTSDDIINSGYAPITEKHLASGMTVADLCAAAMDYSDNCAANLLLKIIGGPAALTKFVRSLGDQMFRLDHWEPELNEASPGDLHDTSTPRAMALSVQRLVLGTVLPQVQRQQLIDWLLANTTGASRVRAGIPADWKIGDKTGTGNFGVANDIAIFWPPRRAPVLVAIYTAQSQKDVAARSDILASCAKIVVHWGNWR